MLKNRKAVVLYSGGADSITLLFYALGKYREVVALSINYGSRHNDKEIEGAQRVYKRLWDGMRPGELKLDHRVMNFTDFGNLGGSPLVDRNLEVPDQVEGKQTVTVVPFRNTLLLTIATSVAKQVSADDVLIGATFEDLPNYPDCRPVYFESLQNTLRLADTFHHLRIFAPFSTVKKETLVEKWSGVVPFELSYTCYWGRDLHCGTCDACRERIQSFAVNGLIDPVPYETFEDLPWTKTGGRTYRTLGPVDKFDPNTLQFLAGEFEKKWLR